MGVIIGSLNTGAVPCVEGHDSPEVTIGNPIIHKTTAGTGDGRWGNYADISMVRDISVKRKFLLKKVDIPAVTAWLASLNGQSTQYNTGTASPKSVAGVFTLDDKFVFSSISPQMAAVDVTFTGQVLDCNFLLPAGLTFEKKTDKKYEVKIGTTVIKSYESSTDGDGTGIEIRSGPVLMWDEVPYPAYLSLDPATEPVPTSSADIAASYSKIYTMAAYRELYMTINGERITTWYIPSSRPRRGKTFKASKIYYGVTDAEWVAAGNMMPTLTENISMETGSARLSGPPWSRFDEKKVDVQITQEQEGVYAFDDSTRQWVYNPYQGPSIPVYVQQEFKLWRKSPTKTSLGLMNVNLCTEALQASSSWTPVKEWEVTWPAGPIVYFDGVQERTLYIEPNPYPYLHYGLLGYTFLTTGTYNRWTAASAVVAIYWKSVSTTRVQLVARGSEGTESVLVDWASA